MMNKIMFGLLCAMVLFTFLIGYKVINLEPNYDIYNIVFKIGCLAQKHFLNLVPGFCRDLGRQYLSTIITVFVCYSRVMVYFRNSTFVAVCVHPVWN